jgi:biotin carboxyl carrier protein
VSRLEELEALVEASGEGGREVLVKAPEVGLLSDTPRVGEIVVGGSRVGVLSTLGVKRCMVLPAATTGRVARRLVRNLREPVEHGQVVLELAPVQESEVGVDVEGATASRVEGLPEGCFAITSPTHGMFYRRPSPDSPAYVNVGDEIEQGTTIALVEVMKCFSAINYGTDGQPPDVAG